MKKYPNVTVKVIFRYRNETLILGHKNGVFSFPGGRINWGESILGALNRELKEELSVNLIDMIYFSTHQAVHFQDKNKLILMESYLASIEGNPIATSEISEFIWIDSSYKEKGIKIASIDEDYILPELKKFGLID